MSLDQELINFIQRDHKLSTAKEIIFYGGSFNPWHDGHTACIKMVPQISPLVIIPDNNPHKELNKNKSLDIDGLKTIIAHHNLNATVFLEFYQSSHKTPTVDWLLPLKVYFPFTNLSLLVGTDTFMGLTSWKDANILLRSLDKIYVVSRMDKNYQIPEQVKQLKSFAPKLEIQFLGNHNFEDVSSSEIRLRKSNI